MDAADSWNREHLADLAALLPPWSLPPWPIPPVASCWMQWQLQALGSIHISSSLQMPTGRLWCTLCSGSHQKVSCGYPRAATSWGHQVNDSSSQGLLGLEWCCKAQQQHQTLSRRLSSWGLASLPTCCPFRTLMSVTEPHLTWASRRNKSPVAQLVPVSAPQPSPTRALCLQSEQELSEGARCDRCVTGRCRLTHAPTHPQTQHRRLSEEHLGKARQEQPAGTPGQMEHQQLWLAAVLLTGDPQP